MRFWKEFIGLLSLGTFAKDRSSQKLHPELDQILYPNQLLLQSQAQLDSGFAIDQFKVFSETILPSSNDTCYTTEPKQEDQAPQENHQLSASARLNQETTAESDKLFLFTFNTKNPVDREQLNTILKKGIEARDEQNKHLAQTFDNHVEWLKKYVNSPEFIELYPTKRNLELVAEAAFWSVELGLAPLLAKMSYAEIREFKPLEEWTVHSTERSALIEEVARMLEKPANSFEVSFAIGQAAWASYVKENGYAVMKEEEERYESGAATSRIKSKRL